MSGENGTMSHISVFLFFEGIPLPLLIATGLLRKKVAGQEKYPMEVVEQEKKPPLIIGRSASSTLFKEKGCGVTSSPKRQLPALTGLDTTQEIQS